MIWVSVVMYKYVSEAVRSSLAALAKIRKFVVYFGHLLEKIF